MSAEERQSGPVRYAWRDAARDPALDDGALDELGSTQRERFEALSGSRAIRFLTGRALLADLIRTFTPDDVAIGTRCPRCGSSTHGPASTRSGRVAVSISYAEDLVVAAAVDTTAARSLGVDIEPQPDDDTPLASLAALFTPAAPPTLRGWTAIEAVLKADGRGVEIAPSAVAITNGRGSVLPGSHLARVPDRTAPIEVTELAGPDGYVVSCAIDPAPR